MSFGIGFEYKWSAIDDGAVTAGFTSLPAGRGCKFLVGRIGSWLELFTTAWRGGRCLDGAKADVLSSSWTFEWCLTEQWIEFAVSATDAGLSLNASRGASPLPRDADDVSDALTARSGKWLAKDGALPLALGL